MAFTLSSIKRIALSTIFGGVGSILIGLLFYHLKIFDYHNWAFSFIVLGFCFAYLYSSLENKVNYIGPVLIVLFISIVILHSYKLNVIIRETVYISVLSIAVYGIYIIINKKLKGIMLYRIALWGCVFGIGYLLATVILALIHSHSLDMRAVAICVKHGLLIGSGIGIGIEIKNKVIRNQYK